MYFNVIDKTSKIAKKRRKTIVVDLFDNLGRERTSKHNVLSKIPGPINRRK